MVDGISSAVPGALVSAGISNQTRIAAPESTVSATGRQAAAGSAVAQQGRSAVGAGQSAALATGDTLLAAQQQGEAAQSKPKAPGELTDEQKQQVAKLKQIDAKVHAHERAHAAVGGQYAGAPHYSYTRGPDGQQYATGGEVSIDIGAERDPEATLQKATQVQAAALAPVDPSGQDRAVAAAATQLRLQALAEIRTQKQAAADSQDATPTTGKAVDGQARQGGNAQPADGDSATETSAAAAPGTAPGAVPRTGADATSGASGAAAPGGETPAARASRAYANDNAGLNRLVGQVVGISA